MKKLLLASTLLLGFAPHAHAQQPQQNTFTGYAALGVFATPEYEGSEDLQAVPLLAARLQYNQFYIENRGLGLQANVSPYRAVEFGPAFSFRFGRDDDVDNDTIAQLSEIDDAFEAGGFVKVPFNNVLTERDELALNLSVLTDVSNAHDGTIVTFGPSYSYAMTPRFRLTTSASASYADDNYMETYYNITAADSGASGLNQFEAEGGIKDVSLTFVGNYAINQRWGVLGLVSYERLVGDAADSPIVDDEGTENQFRFGLAASYRF